MLFLVLGVIALCLFAVGVARDRRRLGNGVYLLFAVVFLGLWAQAATTEVSELLGFIAAIPLLISPLLVLALPGFLIANGLTMLRREGRRPANLLSLAAGVGIIGLFALLIVAVLSRSAWLITVAGSLSLVVGYVAFLFTSFLLYSFVYGRMTLRKGMDAIVVLGSGLVGGSRVPPLLASRLDRAARLHGAENGAGRDPLVITSGGQGPGEDVPEAVAMAGYLVQRGVPEERIAREDRSTTTQENLLFSKALLDDLGVDSRMVVVTNNFHVLRTAVLTRRLGLRAEVVGSPTARYFLPSAMLREFTALFVQYRTVNAVMCTGLAAIQPLVLLAAR
ncbi:hypothetical protein CFN78_06530 [Amycolatopsis antarctica]|uniref:DUF218 domain-containing protein n=1 Tax=Amycolatopsis antarctica TaxID=1854586 RepID=A0A263D601_9PSEU|nr:YdcF family protein [Amycolatopsis antarctica]OZM73942.1 hypothetical protein CFN78_06530 [Amycolatopsis antarctica]